MATRPGILFGKARLLLWVSSLAILPVLALLPFGILWLWQQGWLLWWLLAAAALAVLGYLPPLWWRWRSRKLGKSDAAPEPVSGPDADWSPQDLAAWDEVKALSREADPSVLGDRDRLLAAARATIDKVAAHYHPEDPNPIWSFTVPELLLLTERVSSRLRAVVLDHVPGVHLIEAGHALKAWEYRPMATTGYRVARRLHNVWRVARLSNPVAALLAEARQQIVGATLNEAGDYLRRQGAQIWVEEVGRAAIELYSGRLRIDPDEIHALAAAEALESRPAETTLPGPIRILVAGRTGTGKSTLVRALLGESFSEILPAQPVTSGADGGEAHLLQRENLPEGLVVDTPGLAATTDIERVVARAWESDLLLWVTAADAEDRTLDQAALNTLRNRFAADPRRSPIPILVVASGIDRLLPRHDRDLPVSGDAPAGPVTPAILAAVERVSSDLAVPVQDVVPARLDAPERAWNVARIGASLDARYAHARRCRAQRLRIQASGRNWKSVLRQTAGAARVIKRRIWG